MGSVQSKPRSPFKGMDSQDTLLSPNPSFTPSTTNVSEPCAPANAPLRSALKSPVNSTEIPLEHYIRAVMPTSVQAKLPSPLFRRTSWISTPTLQKGVKSRVLLFTGSFNPPHIGHKLLLTHAFFRSAYPNVIAAIILPSPSPSVHRKAAGIMIKDGRKASDSDFDDVDNGSVVAGARRQNQYAIKRKNRVKLWRDELLSPWVWIAKYGKECYTAVFRLEGLARKDGFDLEFVVIGGTDYSSIEAGCEFWEAEINEVIIGDFFRPGPCRGVDGSLKKLEPCTEWKCLEDVEALLRRVDGGEVGVVEVLLLLYPDEDERLAEVYGKAGKKFSALKGPARQILEQRLMRSGASWKCEHREDGRQMVQFVPINGVGDEPPKVEVSSSAIRKVLWVMTPKEARKELEDVALDAKNVW
ncbi:hypothetical protein P280DRAFT_469327 [Massarina eburnea CBS 473.64]|uniref:Cytidyltransferase-like domain-containing protein n=1 Tax=Massarina eburnea CBS 473.64 TaxID=1395130 RepID=A0A6A6RZ30_9PLEO|nr:hypothetical protein P280DRAFT_469327 [Massarina eburnea CBS 473.64]